MPGDGNTGAFVSFDLGHEVHLYESLLDVSTIAVSGFGVRGEIEHVTETALWNGSGRQQIAEADQVIVICGEHTEEGLPSVCAELRVACEERTPYFLLLDQRGNMCTKPGASRS